MRLVLKQMWRRSMVTARRTSDWASTLVPAQLDELELAPQGATERLHLELTPSGISDNR